MVKTVELEATVHGYTAEVRYQRNRRRHWQTAGQSGSPTTPLALQALFELVYGGSGEFLRHFHKTVNQDPSEPRFPAGRAAATPTASLCRRLAHGRTNSLPRRRQRGGLGGRCSHDLLHHPG